MAEAATKMSVRNEGKGTDRPVEWRPFESLRREVDRLFEDFQVGSWRSPFARNLFDLQPLWRGEIRAPAVDIVETDKVYEITAELPGMDESNIDVKFADGTLTIKGEKRDQKEEKNKDYYLSERHYGSFQRSFGVPDGVDADKIEANFKNGVLTVTLPKTPQAHPCGHIFRRTPGTSTARPSITPSRRIWAIRGGRNGYTASRGRRSSAPT